MCNHKIKCEHELKECEECGKVHCLKCGKEWVKPADTIYIGVSPYWYPTVTPTYPIITYTTSATSSNGWVDVNSVQKK